MARITVEDCLEKIRSQYDLVLLAKERTSQLNAGDAPLLAKENDKNTVISLREIGEGKIAVKTLEDSAIDKLRKNQPSTNELDDLEEDYEDDFEKTYKGEVSKSGTAVLPSKRIRRVVDKTPQQLESVVDDDQVSVSPKVDKEFLVEDAKPEDAKPEDVKPEDVKPKDVKPEDSNS
jgi:DNA-directed RNA polymerase subunit omega